MASANAVVAAAASQVGYRATAESGKFCDWYGQHAYWCNMFVSWCAAQAGATAIIPRGSYTPATAQWFKNKGQWVGRGGGARRGDIVYFDFPGGPNRISHVGIVESVRPDGSLVTIEGNTSPGGGSQSSGGAVARKIRPLSYVVGFGRPAYNGNGAPAAAPAQQGYPDIRGFQHAVRAAEDNIFGPDTSNRWDALYAASRMGGGRFPFGVQFVQGVVGTAQDGSWGPASARAHDACVGGVQQWAGITIDGQLGPQTRDTVNGILGRARRG